MSKRLISSVVVLLFTFFCNSCRHPEVVPDPPEYDGECRRPPPSVFTAVGIELGFAQSTYKGIVTGDIKVQTRPEVISLASKAVTDEQIRLYLRCLAIKRDGFTQEQAVYLEQMYAFLQTSPTAEQFIAWQKDNPFPLKDTPRPLLKEVEKEAFSEKPIFCIGRPSDVGDANKERIEVSIPQDAQVIQVYAFMKNAAWMSGGVPCHSDLGSDDYQPCQMNGDDCAIKWSRVTDYQESTNGNFKIISAKFWNWKHDNERTGKLVVKYRVFE